MNRRSSYNFIYKLQRIILLALFFITALAISVPLATLFTRFFPNHFYSLLITLIAYIIIVVIVGSLIHVISYIPFNLATAFDPIKNDIASGKITSVEQLGKRITAFTVDFYNFSFLDISHAFVQIEGSAVMGHEVNSQVEHVLKEYNMQEKSRELEQVIRAGRISLAGGNYQLYILPIWFGERWLGYMAFLSRKRISTFFLRFLMEYEENFLDDQFMLMINFDKR